MINIKLNENTISVAKNISLKEILMQTQHSDTGYAVAINKTFVPRSQHATTFLAEGDQIDIVSPMQGG